jgi:hypothetical protein
MNQLKNILIKMGFIFLSLGFYFVVLKLRCRLAGYEAIHKLYSKPSLFFKHDPLLGWSHERNSEDVYIGANPWAVEFSTKKKWIEHVSGKINWHNQLRDIFMFQAWHRRRIH